MARCYLTVAFWGYLCLAKRCIIWSDNYQETRTLWNQEDNIIPISPAHPLCPPFFLRVVPLFILSSHIYSTLSYSLYGPQHIKIKKIPSNPNKKSTFSLFFILYHQFGTDLRHFTAVGRVLIISTQGYFHLCKQSGCYPGIQLSSFSLVST